MDARIKTTPDAEQSGHPIPDVIAGLDPAIHPS
jgi:hypothetical protein